MSRCISKVSAPGYKSTRSQAPIPWRP